MYRTYKHRGHHIQQQKRHQQRLLRAKRTTDAVYPLQGATDQAEDDRHRGQHEASTRNDARRETTV